VRHVTDLHEVLERELRDVESDPSWFTSVERRQRKRLRSRRIRAGIVAVAVFAVPVLLLRAIVPDAGPRLPASRGQSGDRFVTLEGPTLTGGSVSPADYEGHVLVAVFWATWCGTCKDLQANVLRAAAAVRGKGVSFVGVVERDSQPRARSFIRRNDVGYPTLMDPAGRYARPLDIRGIPTTFIVGSDGVIRDRLEGSQSATTLISSVRAATSPPSASGPFLSLWPQNSTRLGAAFPSAVAAAQARADSGTGGSWQLDPESVARRFALDFMGWKRVAILRRSSISDGSATVTVSERPPCFSAGTTGGAFQSSPGRCGNLKLLGHVLTLRQPSGPGRGSIWEIVDVRPDVAYEFDLQTRLGETLTPGRTLQLHFGDVSPGSVGLTVNWGCRVQTVVASVHPDPNDPAASLTVPGPPSGCSGARWQAYIFASSTMSMIDTPEQDPFSGRHRFGELRITPVLIGPANADGAGVEASRGMTAIQQDLNDAEHRYMIDSESGNVSEARLQADFMNIHNLQVQLCQADPDAEPSDC
jgi:thiol-disulfide isomerase/thioredoxin